MPMQVLGRQITIRDVSDVGPSQRRSGQSMGPLPSEPSHHPFLVDNIAMTPRLTSNIGLRILLPQLPKKYN